MRAYSVFASVLTIALVIGTVSGARAQPRSTPEPQAALLDVPYVPQSEALCGGAAVAMVFRYWGGAAVHAEDFASLVSERAEGIALGDLTRAVGERGWRAFAFAGTPADVRGHLARGRPVIALVEDRPGRHHYVVVVAWTAGQIVVHDPARGAFRVIAGRAFERAWAVTGRTTLLILPGAEATAVPEGDRVSFPIEEKKNRGLSSGSSPACGPPLDEAVRLAHAGDLETAERLLTLVADACPAFSGGPRELAGVRFLQKRWADAARSAAEAVGRDPSDMHAWQLLASSRFLDGDAVGALAAWNRRHEPRVDLTRVEGLDRTHHDVVAGVVNLPSQTLLTARDLRRAARRVEALPAVQMARVGYSPRANGLATVDVAVVERPLLPASWPDLMATAIHAATAREARLHIASPSGNGELWTIAGRWWAARPRLAMALETPRLWKWPGQWRVDGGWEQQTYQDGSADFTSDRRRAALTFGEWASDNVRWSVSGAVDRWRSRGHHVAAAGTIERRFFDDRVALGADGGAWRSLAREQSQRELPPSRQLRRTRRSLDGGGRQGQPETDAPFLSGAVVSTWRSAREGPATWTAQAGLSAVSAHAPLDLWPGAGTGHARAPLLRAHPLLEDGTIRASGLARTVAHGTLEVQRPMMMRPMPHLTWAAFVDVAKLGHARVRRSVPMQVDVGGGLRVQLPGTPGRLRVDVARGLRDGQYALSAAWQTAWPAW